MPYYFYGYKMENTAVSKRIDREQMVLYQEQRARNKSQRMKNEYIKLQMMEFYMTNRGLTYDEILMCIMDAAFDAGTASLLTVTIIHGIDRLDKYLRNKAGQVANAVVEGAQIVGETVVDAAETVRDNSAIVDEGATLITNIVSTGDWVIGGIFGGINYIFDYGGKAQSGEISCPFCEEELTILKNHSITPTNDTNHITNHITNHTKKIFHDINLSFYQLLYNEITSIPGLVLCVIFLWKLKIYYVREREKKERLRTSVVFTQGFPVPTDASPKTKETFLQQFFHSL